MHGEVDYWHWHATLRCTSSANWAGSPYYGAQFHLEISIPDDYPVSPPTVRFITAIFHPNIDQDGGTQGRAPMRPCAPHIAHSYTRTSPDS